MDMANEYQTGVVPSLTTLIDRAGLIRRWQHGSDAFFWRQERAGRLLPVLHGGLLRYRWRDVFEFEGGLPPADRAAEYFSDLMRPAQVATVLNCAPDFILKAARKGVLPARRVGRSWRFVPGEVGRWQQQSWASRPGQMNGISRKIASSPSGE